jgi:hypothetical protein
VIDAALGHHFFEVQRLEFTHTLVRELTHGRETRDVFASAPKPAMPEESARLNLPALRHHFSLQNL